MKQKNKRYEQLKLFDNYGQAIDYGSSSSRVTSSSVAANFLSELKEQRNSTQDLLAQIVEYGNIGRSISAVESNKGSSGIDDKSIEDTVGELKGDLKGFTHSVLEGTYKVSAVKSVEIEKPNGGIRQLGIPTVRDRILQQAIHQRLNPLYDRHFSESSFGFRPNRSAQDAIKQARSHVQGGLVWVVDIDLASYFDTIPHNRLMQRLNKGIGDKRLLRLIHEFLRAGMMKDGLTKQRIAGAPQGGPLSPLLSNIVLDELDKELEKRGHKFCRYADDCNVFVGSKKAGLRLMKSITEFIEVKLKLKNNREKSGVKKCDEVNFLGYTIMANGKVRVSDKSVKRLKVKIIETTKRNRGYSLGKIVKELNSKIRGWSSYFRLAETYLSTFKSIDGWIRRRLRCYRIRQCVRRYTTVKFLMSLGVTETKSWNATYHFSRWWCMTTHPTISKAMGLKWFRELGLYSIHAGLTMRK